jgi:hypothetical protein
MVEHLVELRFSESVAVLVGDLQRGVDRYDAPRLKMRRDGFRDRAIGHH